MEQVEATTVAELTDLIAKFGDKALFRGQTSHYGEDGRPSVVTSFDRQGCIPSEMLKWSRYAKNVLDAFIRPENDGLDFQQALLQHYGWRSFYIDCTSNSNVAAWFASHIYSEQPTVEMSEDCEERPVWLRKRMACYNFEDGDGYLYIFDKPFAESVGLVDLSALTIEDSRPRPIAQSAWLLGPLRRASVPDICFRVQIKASRTVFRDYAAEAGIIDTNILFPPATEDPILRALLGLPWREIESVRDPKFPIPAFRRTLDLPEYHDSFVKIAWPRTAFFSGRKIADTFGSIDGDHVGGTIMTVPDVALFGSADEDTPMRFPKVEALVEENGTVSFEIDNLIQHANMGHLALYQKGIGVVPHEPDLFEVCELLVEHPGLDLVRAGLNKGWFYRIGADGIWSHESNENECDCGSQTVHNLHISALHIIEAFLQNPKAFKD